MNSPQVFFREQIPHRLPVNSVIQYRKSVRIKRIKELGQDGLNQAQIAEEMGLSYSTIKRLIARIRKDLD
jgi:DNA-binding transcriptional regulator LsrR (DeoR family)